MKKRVHDFRGDCIPLGKEEYIYITGTVISYPDKPMEEVEQGTVLEFDWLVGKTFRNSNVREVLLEVLHLN